MTGARNRAHWGGNALFIRPNVRCRKRPMAKKGQKIKGRPEGSLVAIIADEAR